VTLSRAERREVAALLRAPPESARVTQRLRIVLRASRGESNEEIARSLRVNPGTVARWRRRFLMQRIPGVVTDAPRAGRPSTIPPATVETIVWRKLGGLRPGATPWSARRVAASVGVSKTTVQRIWRTQEARLRRAAGRPRPEPDTEFAERVTDLVGLYLNLPERAMVFSVDERTRGSALGARERRAIAELRRPGHGLAFRAFLQAIERETPPELDLHLLLDGRMAPLPPAAARWLAGHPRFHLHFLPSESPNPTLIDRWFRDFSQRRIRSGAFPSVVRLHRSIQGHFAQAGSAGRPFIWNATAEEIRDRTGKARPRGERPPAG
jgi:DNA-binding CsgD family transcriptional regulator